jgi:diadenosine tetraphosphate (Ap4A) HIT family hydrolase
VSDCVICALIKGELERSVPYEDDETVVVVDLNPVVRGHMFVVPRRHAPQLADLEEHEVIAILRTARRAAAALRASQLRVEGVNLFLADGEAAGQEIFHAHLHVIPRHAKDQFGPRFPADYGPKPRAELDTVCELVKEAWPA